MKGLCAIFFISLATVAIGKPIDVGGCTGLEEGACFANKCVFVKESTRSGYCVHSSFVTKLEDTSVEVNENSGWDFREIFQTVESSISYIIYLITMIRGRQSIWQVTKALFYFTVYGKSVVLSTERRATLV